MKQKNAVVSLLFLFSMSLLFYTGCTDKYEPTSPISGSGSSCVHCHLNAELLKEVATPIPPPTGEAGEG
ncbi:hypothetical protein GF337_02975 [candidate division KSB1 bacterium]|nr:hypothetical protein [candidate division KSB1 bacterium]